MKGKLLTAVAAAAVLAAVALAGTAVAGGGAETKVTIKAESGGFYGYVKSPKPNRCAEGRKIKLYKQKGHKQRPKVDEKIASDTASANGDRYMWSTGNTGISGKFYAKAGKISGCRGDLSKTIHSQR